MDASLPLIPLRRAVGAVWPVCARPQGRLPALGCVLLAAEGGQVRLRATDLEMMLDLTVAARVREDGIAVPIARDLRALLGRLPPGRVRLASGSDAQTLTASCRGVTGAVPVSDPALFPDARPMGDEEATTLPASVLKRLLAAVVFAVADLAAVDRGILSGGLCVLEPGRVTVAGANGFILAVASQEIDTGLAAPRSIVVRGHILRRLAALLPEGDDPATLAINAETLAVSWGPVRLVARLMEGEYPDYRSLIPTEGATEAAAARADLAAAVAAATLRPASKDHACVLAVALDTDHVEVRGRLDVTTFGRAPVPAGLGTTAMARAAVTGEPASATFKTGDLAAILSALAGAERVTLALHGPTRPGVLRAVDDEAVLIYIFMPMVPHGGDAG